MEYGYKSVLYFPMPVFLFVFFDGDFASRASHSIFTEWMLTHLLMLTAMLHQVCLV